MKYDLLYLLKRLHRDERGNLGVLLLLTVWALVVMLAVLWNTSEYATRRQVMQNSADTTAHSAATWMARSLNAVAVQNMVIAQDAAAETIWRAVPAADTGADVATPHTPGSGGIKGELNAEIALAQAMKKNPWLGGALQRLQQALAAVYEEEAQTQAALGAISGSYMSNMPDPTTAKNFGITIRQAGSAMGWVNNTYMGGAMPPNNPPAPQRPGPPGPNGQGLAQLVAQWNPSPQVEAKILDLIISYINGTEMPILTAFEQRTAPATSQAVDQQMNTHEQEVYTNETQMVDGTPTAIEAQRSQLASFYHTSNTLASMQNTADQTGPAAIASPCEAAKLPESMTVADTITGRSVVVDPINPQTNNTITGDARITYPDPVINIPMVGSYTLNCNVPGGWGHIWAMPVERHYNDRVWNDQQTLRNAYMVPIDNSRNNLPTNPRDLAYQIRLLLGLPAERPNIGDLPGSIPDDTPDDKGIYQPIYVMPALTAPGTASAKFRTQVDLYNQHAAKFTGAIRRLRALLLSFVTHYDRFTNSFAVDTWGGAVSAARDYVVEKLGEGKCFMVLDTYKLRYIPSEWQAGMRDSASLAIADQIVEMNINAVTQQIVNDLIASNPNKLGGGILDPTTEHDALYGGYIGQASQLATAALTAAATPIGQAIAQDWVSRPWPYEITPPTLPMPPSYGIGKDDRQKYFTVIAASTETTATAARGLLPKVFGSQTTKLAAYAQAEAFNWMEFNKSYGGSERFDQVAVIPYGYGYHWRWGQEYIPCPRAWRLSTAGGWSWQSRLAFSDALGTFIQNNQELTSFLSQSGVTGSDTNALDQLNNH